MMGVLHCVDFGITVQKLHFVFAVQNQKGLLYDLLYFLPVAFSEKMNAVRIESVVSNSAGSAELTIKVSVFGFSHIYQFRSILKFTLNSSKIFVKLAKPPKRFFSGFAIRKDHCY